MAISVGEIEATLRLRDLWSGPLEQFKSAQQAVGSALQKMGVDLGGGQSAIGSFASAATLGVGAMAGLTAAVVAADGVIVQLGSRGANVNDVAASFERLTRGMGVDAVTALGNLRKGTVGVITDFDLMKATNKAMGAGLQLTGDQFGTLAEAARALAKTTGKPISEAFDTVTTALTTGRARSLQAAGAFIELKGASTELKAALQSEGETMSTGTELVAKRRAVMEALTGIVERTGAQEVDFAESIEAASAAARNWLDKLASMIGQSPVLMSMLKGISTELTGAFGPGAQGLIQQIVKWIETFAFAQVAAAQNVLTLAGYVSQAWAGIKTVVLGAATAIVGVVDLIGKAIVAAESAAAKLHLVSPEEVVQVKATQAALDGVVRSLWDEAKAAASAAAGHGEFQERLDRGKAALERIYQAMQRGADAAGLQKEALSALRTEVTAGIEVDKEYLKALKDVNSAFETLSLAQQANVRMLHEAGVSESDIAKSMKVTETQVRQLVEAEKTRSHILEEVHKIAVQGAGKEREERERLATFLNSQLITALTKTGVEGVNAFQALERAGVPLPPLLGKAVNQMYGMNAVIPSLAAQARNLTSAFSGMGRELAATFQGIPDLIVRALTGGGGIGGALRALGSQIGATLTTHVGASITGALTGTLGKALSGIVGPLGSLLGPAIGLIGKLFHKEEMDVNPLRQGFISAAGGLVQLHQRLLDVAGPQGEFLIQQLLGAKTMKAYHEAIQAVNTAFDAYKAKTDALFSGMDSLNARTAAGITTQESFNIIAKSTVAVFAEYLQRTGDVAGALAKLSPTLDALIERQQALGLEGNKAIEQLLGLRSVAKANDDVLKAAAANVQMMRALNATGLISQETFTDFGLDTVNQFNTMINRGASMNEALVLMQPSLQALWDAQQKYGLSVDASTQAIIDQAVQQGIVGENAKTVNEQMLAVLTSIRDMLKDMTGNANAFGAAVERIPNRKTIHIDFDVGAAPNIPAISAQHEGVFARPTLALVGDAPEPEYVLHQSTVAALAGRGDGAMLRELRSIRDELMRQRSTIPLAVKDAVLRAR